MRRPGARRSWQTHLPAGLALAWILACQVPAHGNDSPSADGVRFFENKVRPILAEHCHRCHGPDSGKGKGGLRVDSADAILRGGESGPAIVPGEADQSLLILAVRHDGTVSMPPKSKLAQPEIDALAAWVKMGAPWPDYAGGQRPAASTGGTRRWDDKARAFWAFQPPSVKPPPSVRASSWLRSPIDAFVVARLEAAGLSPATAADKRTLLRRATLDLWGIPPTPEEIDAFLRDNSDQAFERVVDRLLASLLYGERWGRHWLDVARYADSNGMDDNLAYSDAWRYRDYVIGAFNADKPFDRFVIEQIAGDLLTATSPERVHEQVVATGFLAIGPKMLAEDDAVKQQMDIVDEQLDTTCRVFLALTMGCARCHDHKFDPLDMGDYYGMAGIFRSTRTMIRFRVDSKWNTRALGGPRDELRLEDLQQIIDRHDNALVNGNTTRMPAQERDAHAGLLAEALKEYAAIPKAMAIGEGQVGDLEIFLRGNHLTRGPVAPRRFPTVLAGSDQAPLAKSTSGRLELARWVTDPRHPLTARVIANRAWRWHFGQGLVRSVDNFGNLGEPPSHPDLLDWLATSLVADGWSLKKLHKRIMLSSTYQMSTSWNEHAAGVDPENRLLWRMPRRRMEAEVLRDSLLATSGQLDRTMGGRPIATAPFENLTATGTAQKPDLYESTRRSVYLPLLRSAVYDLFQAYDFPDPAVPNGDRATTTVAGQALFMMNGQLVEKACDRLAEVIDGEHGRSDQERFADLCRRIFGRPPEPEECSAWTRFIEDYQAAASLAGDSPHRRRRLAWKGLCRALLSSNEYVYVN
jgi:mono/diheme cytochrome c family protein